MRLNINLASQPYEAARRFAIQWGSIIAVLSLVTIGLVGIAASSYMRSRPVIKQRHELEAKIAELDREKRTAEDKLNLPGNRDTRDKSHFLNMLIARKAFSWTQVFAELEKLMPARVHVVSIRPDFTPNNQLQIHLEAIGDTREKANDLVRQLEKSPAFRAPQVREEKDDTGQGSNSQNVGVQFVIVADYVPNLEKPRTDDKPQTEAKAEQKGGQ